MNGPRARHLRLRPAHPRPRRDAFTLLEVLLAIILVDVALLALVGGSATLVGRASDLKVRGAALRAASDRVQTLSIAPCNAAPGTAQGAYGLREAWTVAVPSTSIREISDSVAYVTHGTPASVVLRTRIAC